LLVAYAAAPPSGTNACMLATLTIAPPLGIRGAAARIVSIGPVTFTASVRSQFATPTSPSGS
jgi:hypothetical protein